MSKLIAGGCIPAFRPTLSALPLLPLASSFPQLRSWPTPKPRPYHQSWQGPRRADQRLLAPNHGTHHARQGFYPSLSRSHAEYSPRQACPYYALLLSHSPSRCQRHVPKIRRRCRTTHPNQLDNRQCITNYFLQAPLSSPISTHTSLPQVKRAIPSHWSLHGASRPLETVCTRAGCHTPSYSPGTDPAGAHQDTYLVFDKFCGRFCSR